MTGSVWTLTDQQLRTAQAKITYLGEQSKPIATIAFTVEGNHLEMRRFGEIQRMHKVYDNDETPYTKVFLVSSAEFRNMLAAVKPVVTSSQTERADFLSFCVVVGNDDEMIGQEYFIPRSAGSSFYRSLISAVSADNEPARTVLTQQFKNIYPTAD